jgi:hypothetical protein
MNELWIEKHSFSKHDLLAFAWVSGDHNPIHYSESTVKSRGFEKLIVHGMCLYCWIYALTIKKNPNILIQGFDAKFSSITWVDEDIRVEKENKSELEFKISIYGNSNDELKCVFYIQYSQAA